MNDSTLIRMWSMTLIALLLIVDALTWKIDHALWTMGIAAMSGLGGYEIGVMVTKRRE